MESKRLVDMAYSLAKEKYSNKKFSYPDLWKSLIKKTKLTEEEQQANNGSLYTDILQDPRFIFVGNKVWRLKEYITREEIAALENSLYDFTQEPTDYVIGTEEDSDSSINEEVNVEDDYIDLKSKFNKKAELGFEDEEENETDNNLE